MNIINITSAQYILDEFGNNSTIQATINGEEMQVPMDTANRHYAEILKQVADGTITIAEAD